jgi:HEAT repeat protein
MAAYLDLDTALAHLESDDESLRYTAIEFLGEAQYIPAVTSLAAILLEAAPGTRYIAALALGKIGHEEAVPNLLLALRGDDVWVRVAATSALIKIGLPSVVGLIDAVGDENKLVRRAAAKALGKIGHESARSALEGALDDEDEAVRRFAAEALERIGAG